MKEDNKDKGQIPLKFKNCNSDSKDNSALSKEREVVVSLSEKASQRHRSYVADQLKKLGH